MLHKMVEKAKLVKEKSLGKAWYYHAVRTLWSDVWYHHVSIFVCDIALHICACPLKSVMDQKAMVVMAGQG